MSWLCIGCSTENQDHVSVCPICGIRHSVETTVGTQLFLHEMKHDVKTEITDSLCVVGRCQCGPFSFLSGERFLSENHFCIAKRDDGWYVEHLSRTNPTTLNEMKLEHNIPMLLHDGDIISAGFMCFKVIIVCEEPKKAEEKWKYEITCPICGTNYAVDNENSVIEECTSSTCCNDDIDKFEIAHVRAVKTRID